MPRSRSSLLVHLVFSTNNREALLTPEIEPELFAFLGGVFRDVGCPRLDRGGTADHVHLPFRLSRTATAAGVVEEVKKSSSRWIKTKGREFGRFAWRSGYGAYSVSESAVAAVRGHLARQKEHHQVRTYQEEMRLFLEKHGIEFDER